MQFLPIDGGGLYCEAVSNEFLGRDDRLSPDDEMKLIDLGWASPDPNFKMIWACPVPVHVVAQRMVDTLKVYGLGDPPELRVKSGALRGGKVKPPNLSLPPSNGCEACRPSTAPFWGTFRWEPDTIVNKTEVTSSFRYPQPKGDHPFKHVGYFNVYIQRCSSCETSWLSAYYEDFSKAPVEDEWGERTWIVRPVTQALVDEIIAAAGMKSLDVDTFGGGERCRSVQSQTRRSTR